jgi:hypothetical protein
MHNENGTYILLTMFYSGGNMQSAAHTIHLVSKASYNVPLESNASRRFETPYFVRQAAQDTFVPLCPFIVLSNILLHAA